MAHWNEVPVPGARSTQGLIFPLLGVLWVAFGNQDAAFAQTISPSPPLLNGVLSGALHRSLEGKVYQSLCSTGSPFLIPLLLGGLLLAGGALMLGAIALWRGKMQRSLQQNEERLRLALDAAHMGVWEADLRTGKQIWSPPSEAIWGLAPGTFDGTREGFLNRIHPDDRDYVQQAHQDAWQTGHYQLEYRIVLPDQTIRWLSNHAQVFYDATGQPIRMIGIDLDVTDRKQAEVALRESEASYRQLAEEMPVLICKFLPDSTLTYVNPAYCEYFNQHPENLIGCRFLDFFTTEAERQVAQARYMSLTPDSPSVAHEHPVVRPDGNEGWQQWVNRAFFDEQGHITSLQAIGFDITDRKRIEIDHQKQQARLNLALEVAKMGTWEGNLVTGEEILSPQLEALLGFAPGTFDGRRATFLSRVHPDDFEQVEQAARVAIETGQLQDEYRIVLPDQTIRWIGCLGKVFYDEAGHPLRIVGVDLDITERKQAEVELRQQKEILQTIFDHLPIMVGLYSAQGEVLIINRELERVIGWTQADYQTVDVIRECYPNPADYEQVLSYIMTADSLWHDSQLRTRDGRILDTSWAQIRLSDGCSIGIGQDITERKQAERALRESETRFRQLAENIQEVFWMADVDFTQILYVSPAYEAIWGSRCDSLYENAASFMAAIHPEDCQRVLPVIQQQRYQGWDQEYRIVRPDGTLRWIWEQAYPVSDQTGHIHRVVGICQDISDRKAAEFALAESQKQYQNLIENSPDIIERFDLELRHLYVSPILTRLSGIPGTEFLGKTCRDLGMDETMVNTWEAAAAELLATQTKQVIEFETLTLDGIRSFEMAIVPELSDQQTIESILCISRDISDRKAAKAALEQRLQQEQALNRVFQAIRQSLDLDTIFATATAEMSQLVQGLNSCVVQYLPAQEVWKTIAEFRSVPSLPSFIGMEVPDPGNPFAAQLKRREIVRVEATDRLEDQINQEVAQTSPGAWLLIPLLVGDKIWGSFTLNTSQQPFTWTEEQIELAQAVANQLEVAIQQAELYQQVKQEQQNLLKSQTALIQAQQIAQVGSWELDARTQAMVWSDTLFQIFGFDPVAPEPDFVDVMMNHIHPDDRPRLEQVLMQAMTGGNSYEIDLRFFRTDGSMGYMEARAEAIHNEQEQIVKVVGTLLDISDRKRSELEIRQLNEALEQQNQNLEVLVEQRTAELVQRTVQLEASNKELESFSYSVSHDLRAPLRHIHGFVNALQQRLQTHNALADPKVTHYLQVIESSSQKMALLIDGLLTLSRLGRKPMVYAPVRLRDLVNEAIALVKSSVEPAIPVEFVISELPTVQGDATLLQQVFSNLIHNAVKFSRHHPAPRIDIGSLPDGTIFVKDNGAGFQMEYADKLFGAFQRLHSQTMFEGTGIGLAIVQRIIHRHGGTIWAESQPDQGATFYFTVGGSA